MLFCKCATAKACVKFTADTSLKIRASTEGCRDLLADAQLWFHKQIRVIATFCPPVPPTPVPPGCPAAETIAGGPMAGNPVEVCPIDNPMGAQPIAGGPI